VAPSIGSNPFSIMISSVATQIRRLSAFYISIFQTHFGQMEETIIFT
jgi:hypothetical protein